MATFVHISNISVGGLKKTKLSKLQPDLNPMVGFYVKMTLHPHRHPPAHPPTNRNSLSAISQLYPILKVDSWEHLEQVKTGSRQGQGKVNASSRQGKSKVRTRLRQGQCKVKTRSRQGQDKVKSKSSQGQGNVKAMSRQCQGQGN